MGSYTGETTMRTTRWVMAVFKSGLAPRLTTKVSARCFHRRPNEKEKSATIGSILMSFSGDLQSCHVKIEVKCLVKLSHTW